MFTRCLFCHSPFPAPRAGETFGGGQRVAFDSERGRLWQVCGRCRSWSLVPFEDRAVALEMLERLAYDRGRLLARTEEVALLEAGGLELVRIGRASSLEEAWWRYGRELRHRQTAFHSPGSRIAALAYGAVAWVGETVGILDTGLGIGKHPPEIVDLARWRHFGGTAWEGREPCPSCGSILCALRFDLSWWIYPLLSSDGTIELGVPCPRCDPWTPEKVFMIRGHEADDAIRRVLAWQHIDGASELTLREASRFLDRAGTPADLLREFGSRRQSLYRLGPLRTLALEIAVNDSVERRLLNGEARALEVMWREQERLADIIDGELTAIA